jgi:hypothetical protein
MPESGNLISARHAHSLRYWACFPPYPGARCCFSCEFGFLSPQPLYTFTIHDEHRDRRSASVNEPGCFGNSLIVSTPGANVWMDSEGIRHAQILLNSFRQFLGRELFDRSGDPTDEATRLFDAPFVVVSHGTQADPILNYGNRTALKLWETDLATLTTMPSRLTAEPMHRDERAEMMARAARDGYVDDYRGVRITLTGRRFLIDRAIVWNLVDEHGNAAGQAATFSEWKWL